MTTDRRTAGRHRPAGAATHVALRATAGLALLVPVAYLAARAALRSEPHRPEDVLVTGALALVAGGTCWLALLLALTAASALPGSVGRAAYVLARHLAPKTVSAAMTVLLGAGFAGPQIGLAATPPAAAAPTAQASDQATGAQEAPPTASATSDPAAPEASALPAEPAFADTEGEVLPLPGWTPPSAPAPALPTASPRLVGGGSTPGRTTEVVVRAGDTLWDIVSRHLGPDADASRVAHEITRWHDANRNVIGDDPNLLLPGQVLLPPSTGGAR